MNRQAQQFLSHGSTCSADFLLPDGNGPFPCVLMAHGFAAQRDFRLDQFARRFVEAGAAVFLFDYRGFGDSEGLPRQLVSPRRHLQDWHAALSHVRGLPQVDPRRLALWGTSFSGGHAMVVAAQDRRIAAVCAQVPFVSGMSALGQLPFRQIVRLSLAGLRDVLQSLSGGPAYRLPVVGLPGELAMMNTPECLPGYMALVPEGSAWENATPARIALSVSLYAPARHASQITCPVLVVGATRDSLIPQKAVRRAAARIPDCRLEMLECNHFQPYEGEWFQAAVGLQCEFLRQHLALPAAGG